MLTNGSLEKGAAVERVILEKKLRVATVFLGVALDDLSKAAQEGRDDQEMACDASYDKRMALAKERFDLIGLEINPPAEESKEQEKSA